jgi:hypothetical protein
MDEEPPSKIAGTKLGQQALPSLRPVIRAHQAYIIFTFFAVFFFATGIAQSLTVARLHGADMRYDKFCGTEPNCSVSFRVPFRLSGRIVFYYKLTNFYQNHRRYASSVSSGQLAGEYIALDDLDSCDPLTTVAEGVPMAPCGLAASTVFNDTFKISGPFSVPLSESGIAWKSDLESLFKPASSEYSAESRWLDALPQFPGGQVNEHFVVWMRVSALPDVVKLYSQCEDCVVDAETYTVEIENNYPVDMFKGEKWIGLREETEFGTKNRFLEVLCYVYGALWVLCDLAILAITILKPRLPGDPELIRRLKVSVVAARPISDTK